MKILAIIPARGGSKGIPLKNLCPLAGKPLIMYTIEAAGQSRYIDRLAVSTDSEAIAQVARQSHAEVIMRPAEFATDEAATELALIHALDTLRARDGYEPDAVLTLEPTSPLRTFRLIDECVEALQTHEAADSVLTVTETRECLGTISDGRFDHLIKGQPRRRQDRKPIYGENSAVYLTRTDALRRRRQVVGERPWAVVARAEDAIDINTPLDFAVAEAVMRWRQLKEGQ